MHLPNNRIIEHYNPGNRSFTDISVMRKISNSTDYGQEKNENVLNFIHSSEKQNVANKSQCVTNLQAPEF